MATKNQLEAMENIFEIEQALNEIESRISNRISGGYIVNDDDNFDIDLDNKEVKVKYKFEGKSADKYQSRINSLNQTLEETDTLLSNISREIDNLNKSENKDYEEIIKKENELLDEQYKKREKITNQLGENKNLQEEIKKGFYNNWSTMKEVDISNFSKSDFEQFNPYADLNKEGLTQAQKEAYENGQELWNSSVDGWLNAKQQHRDLNGKTLSIIGDIADSKTSIKSIEEEKLKIVEDIQNQIIDVIRKMYEDERDEAINSIDEISKVREKAHNKRIKQLEEEKQKQSDVYDDLIKKIDRTESEHDYDNEQRKLLNDKSSLQKQYNMLLGDNSREAQAQREELKRKIDEIDYQINESTHDREVDLRKQSIQDSKEAYQEKMDNKIDKANEEYEAMREQLEKERKITEEFYEDKLTQSNLYLEGQRKLLDGSFKDLSTSITEHLNKFGDGLSIMGKSLKSNVIDNLKIVKGLLDEINIKNNMNVSGSLSTPSISSPNLVTSNSVTIQVEKLINIEGNADSSSVSKIQSAGQGTLASLEKACINRGFRL